MSVFLTSTTSFKRSGTLGRHSTHVPRSQAEPCGEQALKKPFLKARVHDLNDQSIS